MDTMERAVISTAKKRGVKASPEQVRSQIVRLKQAIFKAASDPEVQHNPKRISQMVEIITSSIKTLDRDMSTAEGKAFQAVLVSLKFIRASLREWNWRETAKWARYLLDDFDKFTRTDS